MGWTKPDRGHGGTAMTHHELRDQWATRRTEYQRLGVYVDGAKVIEAFLTDLDAVMRDQADELLSLSRAAHLSGYSTGHLARLIRSGQLPNAGRPNAPKIRRADLPRKATALPNVDEGTKLPTKAQIARSIVHPHRSNDG